MYDGIANQIAALKLHWHTSRILTTTLYYNLYCISISLTSLHRVHLINKKKKNTDNQLSQEQEGMKEGVHSSSQWISNYMYFMMSFAGFCCVCNNVSRSLWWLFEVQKRQRGQLTALPEAHKERFNYVLCDLICTQHNGIVFFKNTISVAY